MNHLKFNTNGNANKSAAAPINFEQRPVGSEKTLNKNDSVYSVNIGMMNQPQLLLY